MFGRKFKILKMNKSLEKQLTKKNFIFNMEKNGGSPLIYVGMIRAQITITYWRDHTLRTKRVFFAGTGHRMNKSDWSFGSSYDLRALELDFQYATRHPSTIVTSCREI